MWIVFAVCLAGLLVCVYAYRVAFYVSPRLKKQKPSVPQGAQYQGERERMLALIRELEEIPYEPVTIRARDGMVLAGRYYHVRDGAPLQIQFHGYRGGAVRDFCGGNKLARESGQNTLLVDQRAHGNSGGSTITFGIRERWDCLSWAEYARSRFGPETPIFLSGVSMGAATVLMASELDLPDTVAGIIADCPYTSPRAIIRKVCRDRHLPPALTYPFIRLSARLFGGFRLEEASALEAVGRARVPILLIHGEADRFVPCGMSREIAGACASPCRLETFPGAGHGLSYIVDAPRYGRLTAEFMDTCLKERTCR